MRYRSTTRLDELMRDMENCDGFRIRADDRSLRASLWTFEANYRDFSAKVSEFAVPKEALRLMGNRASRDATLLEATRTLHNFLASGYTLSCNTETRMKRLYRGRDPFFAVYERRRDRDLDQNRLCQFALALRGAATHAQLHTPSGRVRVGLGHSEAYLYIVKSDVKPDRRWDPLAAQFFASKRKEIRIAPIAHKYFLTVTRFHQWLSRERNTLHAAEFAKLKRLEHRVRRYRAREG
jgi:hypothetical protein